MEIILKSESNFSFLSTLYSHGWSDLLPFRIDSKNKVLHYHFELHSDETVGLDIQSNSHDEIVISTTADSHLKNIITAKVKRIFRLDEDLSEFYQIAVKSEDFKWIVEKGAGRMLRCATLWEDMVKMLCTTNCTWRLTQIMTENLVQKLGKSQTFPSAATIAETDETFLRDQIKMGYRAPYLLQFAKDVAEKRINLYDFDNWRGDSTTLYREIRKIKGFGDYAVSSLMKLLGRYDFMGFDSWNRKQFTLIHKNGKSCPDEQITKFYKKYGKWAGLFFWLDVTKAWYFKENPWE